MKDANLLACVVFSCLTACQSSDDSKTIRSETVQQVQVMVQRDVWVQFTAFVHSSQSYAIDIPDKELNNKGTFATAQDRNRFIEIATLLVNSFKNIEPPQTDPPSVGGYVYHIRITSPRLVVEARIKQTEADKRTRQLLDELMEMLQNMLKNSTPAA
jgi:hypothetical protein